MVFGHYGRNVYISRGVHIVRPRWIWIGDDVMIGSDTDIYVHPDRSAVKGFLIRIEGNVHIGRNNILGARTGIVIEENVLLGPHVMIADHTHLYEDVELPVKSQGVTEGGAVRIERDSWIGANVFVMPGVVVGRHSVVGANAVVNRSIPPYSVAVGAPARVIKQYDFGKKEWVKVGE